DDRRVDLYGVVAVWIADQSQAVEKRIGGRMIAESPQNDVVVAGGGARRPREHAWGISQGFGHRARPLVLDLLPGHDRHRLRHFAEWRVRLRCTDTGQGAIPLRG